MRIFLNRLAVALTVTALSVGGWLFVVHGQERAAPGQGCRVSYVYDGDTVAMECGGSAVRGRIMGLDTPETRNARCTAERRAGDAATRRLRDLVAAGPVAISRHGHDRYGRDLIRLTVAGRDVADTMVEEGLAVRYDGGRRPDWCARLARGED